MTLEKSSDEVYQRYRRLQAYVGWTAEDTERVRQIAPLVEPAFDELVEDFYATIQREPQALKVITGGAQQIARLKVTLRGWLEQLFSGQYDRDYVARRWKVGWRHVDIGLDQVYTNAAVSRLRRGLLQVLEAQWTGSRDELNRIARSVSQLLDLDLAIIEDAYQTESLRRQRQLEQLARLAQQKRAEQREAALGRILDDSLNEIYIFDSQTWRFVEVNRGARENIGYTMDELREMTPLDLKPNFSKESFLKLIRPLLTGQTDHVQFKSSHRRNDATQYDVEVHLQLSHLETPPLFVAFILDITEQKQAEQRALQAERLAAIGQTVAGLAHESRNAFQRSQACLEMLALELEGREEELELVARIQRALDHLHHLYEEVRDYAAPIKLDRQPCNLAHVWRDSWAHLEVARKDKAIKLREEIDNSDLTLSADWFALGQVFRNILENAISACPNPGEIVISGIETASHGRESIRVSIRDNGPGIHGETRQCIFDPFFTTKTKGTGLGMAIAKRIVEAHGGQIAVGDPTAGAEILITLPRSLS